MTTVLPEKYLRLMSKEDRRAMCQTTAAESKAKGEARLERDLQRLIYLELLRRGLFFHYSRMDKKSRNMVGTPDFALPLEGRYVAIECKATTGKQSDEQINVQAQICEQEGDYYIVRSFDEFLEVLSDYEL